MRTALIVDDEADVLADLAENINWKRVGIRKIFKALSVREAMESYRLYRQDVIISDMEMVGESGLDLLRKLRDGNEDVLFLFLTCHPDFHYMQQAMRLGSCDYLLKPAAYGEVEDVLIRLISGLDVRTADIVSGSDPIRGDEDLAQAAKSFIKDHLVEKLMVGDIAAVLGCSESHLMKAFKSDTGWSIVEYISGERIGLASHMLRTTDWSVSMISSMCGYDDSAYFTRVFRRLKGMTPSDYRKQHRA